VQSLHTEDSPDAYKYRRSGARTKKAAVEAGLRLLVKTQSQAAIRRLRGKVRSEGILNESRLDRKHG
jgi:hypothetical protein